jgi:hypothetical protein
MTIENNNKESKWREQKSVKDLLSKLNGALFAEGSSVSKTVLRNWWKEILIALLLLIALGGWVQAMRNSARATGLLNQLEQERAMLQAEINQKDAEREQVEQILTERLQLAEARFQASKEKYAKRKAAAQKKWKQPKNVLETAQRFRALGYLAMPK